MFAVELVIAHQCWPSNFVGPSVLAVEVVPAIEAAFGPSGLVVEAVLVCCALTVEVVLACQYLQAAHSWHISVGQQSSDHVGQQSSDGPSVLTIVVLAYQCNSTK